MLIPTHMPFKGTASILLYKCLCSESLRDPLTGAFGTNLRIITINEYPFIEVRHIQYQCHEDLSLKKSNNTIKQRYHSDHDLRNAFMSIINSYLLDGWDVCARASRNYC